MYITTVVPQVKFFLFKLHFYLFNIFHIKLYWISRYILFYCFIFNVYLTFLKMIFIGVS